MKCDSRSTQAGVETESEIDQLLRRFFRYEMPSDWPPITVTERRDHATTVGHAPGKGRLRAYVGLAASLLLLAVGFAVSWSFQDPDSRTRGVAVREPAGLPRGGTADLRNRSRSGDDTPLDATMKKPTPKRDQPTDRR